MIHDRSGGMFLTLFAALALLGVLGIGLSHFINGPLRGATNISRVSIAEMQMGMAARLLIMDARQQPEDGDCDDDAQVEPREWRQPPAGFFPGDKPGGTLPLQVGAAHTDPWGNEYGYCVWNMGPVNDPDTAAACDTDGTGGEQRLSGYPDDPTQSVLAILSAGPDRTLQSTCRDFAEDGATGIAKPSGSDDLILSFSYAEAAQASSTLWQVKADDTDTAETDRSLEINVGGAAARIGYDALLDTGGVGDFAALRTNQIVSRTSGYAVTINDGLKLGAPDTCGAEQDGTLRYSTTEKRLQYCHAESGNWIAVEASYSWQAGTWSTCSASCGSGTQTRSVTCRNAAGAAASDSLCSGAKPDDERECTTYTACSYRWTSDEWSPCSAACGGGLQYRKVSCMRADGMPVEDGRCGSAKPAASQSCNTDACSTYNWQTGSWSSCSAACGSGTQSRSVTCKDMSGATVSDGLCSASKPGTTQSCLNACVKWIRQDGVSTERYRALQGYSSATNLDSARACPVCLGDCVDPAFTYCPTAGSCIETQNASNCLLTTLRQVRFE